MGDYCKTAEMGDQVAPPFQKICWDVWHFSQLLFYESIYDTILKYTCIYKIESPPLKINCPQ